MDTLQANKYKAYEEDTQNTINNYKCCVYTKNNFMNKQSVHIQIALFVEMAAAYGEVRQDGEVMLCL
jgi:hypothetical protein